MASISSLGIGSGMDLSGLLDKLSAAEQLRLAPLTRQQTSFKGRLTAFGVLQSALAKLETASADLKKADKLATTSVGSTNTAFAATIYGSSNAGSYSISVNNLAKAQSILSTEVPNTTDKLGNNNASRTITITQPGNSKPLEVELTSDQTSLSDIRDAINRQEGSVTASIIKADDDTYYLALTSKETGTQSEMTVSVSGDDTLNDFLNYNSATSSGAMTERVKAENAQLTVNGVDITRQSNTINDAPQGVTLTLRATTTEPEQLNIVRDSTATKAAIQSFVDAYNSLQTTFASLTQYVPVEAGESQSGNNGALVGDGTLRGIQTGLRMQLSAAQGGDIRTLTALGITPNLDGKLEIDSEKLDAALTSQPNAVVEFFVGDGKTTGFATQIGQRLNDALNTTTGSIRTATNGINQSLKLLESRIATTTDNINATIERYRAQFTQLDRLVSSLSNTANFLTQQFAS